MARTIPDRDLESWEVFTTTGPYGYAWNSRVVFRCTSDPGERPRAYLVDGDKSDAEARVATASCEDLLAILAHGEVLD